MRHSVIHILRADGTVALAASTLVMARVTMDQQL